jgi:predicted lipoprotein with Yx(FWY)xxD motif
MRPLPTRRPRTESIRGGLLAIALAAALTLALLIAGQAAAQGKRVVSEAENPTLGRTVLTNLKGRTLYSLSVEKHGRFVCTGACLSSWKPLVVPAGVKPKGPVKLGTVRRPDGRTQVTYKGLPLYRFYGDAKNGEANGEGLKDVGTWHAASVAKVSSPPPAPQPESPAYPY